MMNCIWPIVVAVIFPGDQTATSIEVPRPSDDRLVVELVAREPEIVTPTGVAVDERGRIWVIENHTHQRPADYKGPAGDRIRIYDDFGRDGRARRVKTFAEGFKNGMGLALAPNGDLYFATRAEIMTLRDTNSDDVADKQDVIVKLDTAGDYPHNGLSGFAFDAFDNVYFGLGENLGAPYKLIGSDGTTLTGGGEGGNIYRCRPDGSKLVRVATGFWNPFHLTFDAFGRLFAVDNDPDSRPPCRLLHIIQGGDYGYRFRNGRKGLHPFTAWNGELPGTLPMVAGTGEAPSGIVAYESDGLPEEYRGELIVTCWGDHVIQRFKLAERGASFASQAQTMIRGGERFYPVGIAIAPDGSLVVSDWADKSYPLHGKGRIWRIRMTEPLPVRIRATEVGNLNIPTLRKLLGHPRREIRCAAAETLFTCGKEGLEALQHVIENDSDPRARVHVVWAEAKMNPDFGNAISGRANHDSCPAVRAESARLTLERGWDNIAWRLPDFEKQHHPFFVLQYLLAAQTKPQVEEVARRLVSSEDPFLAFAAIDAIARLGGSQQLLRHIHADSPIVRVRALVALRQRDAEFGPEIIPNLLDDPDPAVRRAAIQWVAEEQIKEFEPLLDKAVAQPPVTRELFEAFLAAKEMLAGVTRKPTDEPSGEDFIVKILGDDAQPPALRAIALRSLNPNHAATATSELRKLLSVQDKTLQLETIRTLAGRADDESQALLRELAVDQSLGEDGRATAISGLAHSATRSAETRKVLLGVLHKESIKLELEALRSLRGSLRAADVPRIVEWWRLKEVTGSGVREVRQAIADEVQFAFRGATDPDAPAVPPPITSAAEERPKSEWDWAGWVSRPGASAKSGELVFFHPRGPQCFACHRVNGRGGNVGPDLSAIGRTLDREKLIRSLVTPSKDIAPQYTTWLVATRDGRLHIGIILREDPRGTITLGDAQGKTIEIPVADIEQRQAQSQSIMPENLTDQMTRWEFGDLVEFLSSLK